MKSVLLIGLGRFGRHIASKLNKLGHQVMAVDSDEERVQAVLPYVTNAQIGDSTSWEFLDSLGVRNYDACIVAIGDDSQNSLETASPLKELGARKVIARAATGMICATRCPSAAKTGITASSITSCATAKIIPRMSWARSPMCSTSTAATG